MPSLTEIPSLGFQITLVAVWLGLILVIAEGLNRVFSVNAEVSRKIVHIGTGNVILLAWWLNIPAWVGIAASVISGIIAIISYQTPILPSINSVGRNSLGTFFYAISIGVLIGWFWTIQQPQYAALGILIMAWGDGLAAVIGQQWGKHQYCFLGSSKSWEGSLTMLFVSFIISLTILLVIQGNDQPTWIISIVVALVATTLESFSKYGIDNLTVPFGSASLAFFLNQIL
ncbi:Phytol kinase [Planktothrix tepida]|uniref:Phosphatidate cytidylyltransferase n=2 Tax=Planktothrix TaxID=54304 RepID=A0A1J1LIC2_9CYAN|nr:MULTISPECIES: diacylglycerol/polyprenol kinase family protein [Planktothrix]CAD5931888.1 Phytol kinase [Planktothrix tepida]CAD5978605.1 Phytol kinase [Planktothrix pseudagardhii]CUR31636.1 Phosphatidate cytidylyltransferase [Planktothrix tepida PCC 9214]